MINNKMISNDAYNPIRNIGYLFIAIGILVFLSIWTEPIGSDDFLFLLLFAGTLSVLHLLIGIGIVVRNRILFNFFIYYLYFLYIGFPIGTYISKKTLKYIKEKNILQYLNEKGEGKKHKEGGRSI